MPRKAKKPPRSTTNDDTSCRLFRRPGGWATVIGAEPQLVVLGQALLEGDPVNPWPVVEQQVRPVQHHAVVLASPAGGVLEQIIDPGELPDSVAR